MVGYIHVMREIPCVTQNGYMALMGFCGVTWGSVIKGVLVAT